jgi:hypothetical protein
MDESYPHLDTADLESIRAIHRQNLVKLSIQAAGFGALYVPIALQNQLEQTKAAIDSINRELEQRGIENSDPPPSAPLNAIIQHYHSATPSSPISAADSLEAESDTRRLTMMSSEAIHDSTLGINERPGDTRFLDVSRVNRSALRDSLVARFSADEFEVLCMDIQQARTGDGLAERVSLDIVGGRSLVLQVQNMIAWLDRRGQLGYLIRTISERRPDTAWQNILLAGQQKKDTLG